MSTGIIISISVIGGIVLLILILKTAFSSTQWILNEQVQNKFLKDDIVLSTTRASCFGVKSKGGMQVRGNGALVLTNEVLYFLMAFPRKEFVIPIKSIIDLTTPKSFNGKSILTPLLCVHYNIDSKEDEIAWAVSNLQKWIGEIKKLQQKTE